jgi:ATP-dependent helicase/nuclease subunit A
LICKGLQRSGLPMQEIAAPDGVVKRFGRPEDVVPETASAASVAVPAPIPELPSWLSLPAPRLAPTERTLRPSSAEIDAARAARRGEPDNARERARQRGVLVHRLLQSLPEIAPARRRDAAAGYLVRNTDPAIWPEAYLTALADRVLALIDDPRFKAVFAEGSRAEVPVIGRLTQPGGVPYLVSGQIDRLVVSDAAVLIVDFKTNQTPPRNESEVPVTYLRQLALYRAVLALLYPAKPVRAALLWTEAAEMMEISSVALDRELVAIMSA